MDGKDFKIEIDLEPDCDMCNQYHYVVLAWNGEWYNTGICGVGDTPLHAFAKGYTEFEYQKLQVNDVCKCVPVNPDIKRYSPFCSLCGKRIAK